MIELATLIQHHVYLLTSVKAPSRSPEPVVGDLGHELGDTATSQEALREATEELRLLTYEPFDYLMEMVVNQVKPPYKYLLQAICKFGIASIVPISEEISFESISRSCGLSLSDTKRLLRHAMTYYIFKEPVEGFVVHTPASRTLAENPLLLRWIGSACEEMWPAATKTVEAMIRWPKSQRPDQTGFNIVNGTKDSFFVELEKNPNRARSFGDGMKAFLSRSGLQTSYIVEGYDWATLQNKDDTVSTVVDIGGSHGQVSLEIARRYPFIHCVVQDLPEVLEHSRKVPADLQKQVTFMEHDFFKEQPIKGAAAYFLRWILHDWPDDYAIMILKALLPALAPGSRIILNEVCMPAVGTVSMYQERYIRLFKNSICPWFDCGLTNNRSNDLAMKEISNGHDRSADEWARLLRNVHPDLQVQSIQQPAGSELSIIEIEMKTALDLGDSLVNPV
ncbi:MAG: hypothetical protein Q9191_000464 [Dirinaria sp. TL-2023a]